jgi:hypothetical protein
MIEEEYYDYITILTKKTSETFSEISEADLVPVHMLQEYRQN